MPTKYPSAIDTWLLAVLVGTPIAVAASGVFMLTKSTGAGVALILTGIFCGGVMAAFSFPCFYLLSDESLTVKCGLIQEVIPLSRIQKAEPSGSMLSAPALSMKRVKITLDNGFRLISPENREEFINTLEGKIAKRA